MVSPMRSTAAELMVNVSVRLSPSPAFTSVSNDARTFESFNSAAVPASAALAAA
jgi:hypothetical protein